MDFILKTDKIKVIYIEVPDFGTKKCANILHKLSLKSFLRWAGDSINNSFLFLIVLTVHLRHNNMAYYL